jgi:hypothetical protein
VGLIVAKPTVPPVPDIATSGVMFLVESARVPRLRPDFPEAHVLPMASGPSRTLPIEFVTFRRAMTMIDPINGSTQINITCGVAARC